MAEDSGAADSRRNESKWFATEECAAALMSIVETLITISELRDRYTADHARRVADLAAAIGEEFGFDARRRQGLIIAAKLHDIGKIVMPGELLAKPGHLSEIEFSLIKEHSRLGYEILKKLDFPWPIATVALQHHERMDGKGYPEGLKGASILLEARIISVADVVEAMAAHRAYRASLGLDNALAQIIQGRGSAFDPDCVDACLHIFEKGYQLPN